MLHCEEDEEKRMSITNPNAVHREHENSIREMQPRESEPLVSMVSLD